MQYIKDGNTFVIRLEVGEEIVSSLDKFLSAQKISSAYFSGIGAVQSATLGFYNLKKKKYRWKNFVECEVVSLTGNVAMLNGKPFIHAHMVLSDDKFNCYGGHLKEAVVGATLEIVLERLAARVERKFDKEIGLNLLDV